VNANESKPATARVLNACDKCGRQYDVSHLDAGRKVRCECGASFTVRVQEPHNPRVLKCANCGGVLRDAARKCDYCSAEITLEERRLTAMCPKCFARMAGDAHFCMDCGVAVQTTALYAVAEGTQCPRCKAPLASRVLGDVSLVECSHCGGFWMAHEAFVRACEEHDSATLVERALGERPAAQQVLDLETVHYLKCIACGELMWRKNYGTASGVIIDVCKQHGVWLDARELERILAFVRGGGLARARQLEIERWKEEERRLRDARNAVPISGASFPMFDVEVHKRRSPGVERWGNGVGALLDLLGGFLH
jgi:Zn-finger nucleic acid-binding protein